MAIDGIRNLVARSCGNCGNTNPFGGNRSCIGACVLSAAVANPDTAARHGTCTLCLQRPLDVKCVKRRSPLHSQSPQLRWPHHAALVMALRAWLRQNIGLLLQSRNGDCSGSSSVLDSIADLALLDCWGFGFGPSLPGFPRQAEEACPRDWDEGQQYISA